MVYLVCGPPCSGKSTYIKNNASDGDLICDVDLIYGAISTHDPHDADLYIHEIALLLKDKLLDIIRERKGTWKDAYVVSIASTKEKVKRDKDRINADKVIFLNTPYEVCMDRAKERDFAFSLLIQEWFDENNLDNYYD